MRLHTTRRVPQGRAGAHRPKQAEGAAGYVSCWRMSEQREVQSYDAGVVVVVIRWVREQGGAACAALGYPHTRPCSTAALYKMYVRDWGKGKEEEDRSSMVQKPW